MGGEAFGFGGTGLNIFAKDLELTGDDLEAFLKRVDLLEKAGFLQKV